MATNGTCIFLYFLSSFVQINITLNVHFIIFHMIFRINMKCLQHQTKKKNLQLSWQNEKWMAFCNKFIWWLRESNYRQCVFFIILSLYVSFPFLNSCFPQSLTLISSQVTWWNVKEAWTEKKIVHTPANILMMEIRDDKSYTK